MGVMPEDRGRRWQSVFRRYGIPIETHTNKDGDTNNSADALIEQAKNALLPDFTPCPDKSEASRRKRSR